MQQWVDPKGAQQTGSWLRDSWCFFKWLHLGLRMVGEVALPCKSFGVLTAGMCGLKETYEMVEQMGDFFAPQDYNILTDVVQHQENWCQVILWSQIQR